VNLLVKSITLYVAEKKIGGMEKCGREVFCCVWLERKGRENGK
jgi:hypothetical protein